MSPASPAGDRLNFQLPDFTRFAWVSEPARWLWEPSLRRIARAWAKVEWRSIAAGARACGLATVSAEGLVAADQRWAAAGPSALPLQEVGVLGMPYASTAPAVEPGKPRRLRVAIGAPGDVVRLKDRWVAQDHDGVGELLGYPACCRRFFQRV